MTRVGVRSATQVPISIMPTRLVHKAVSTGDSFVRMGPPQDPITTISTLTRHMTLVEPRGAWRDPSHSQKECRQHPREPHLTVSCRRHRLETLVASLVPRDHRSLTMGHIPRLDRKEKPRVMLLQLACLARKHI